jgi:hypothetical protein
MSDQKLAQEAYDKVLKYFCDDHEKTWKWFLIENPGLSMKPIDMIKKGRVKKLLLFIDSRLNGYWT